MKQVLRKKYLRMRDSLPQEDIVRNSQVITQKIMQSDDYRLSEKIFVYYHVKSEVITKDIIENALLQGKTVCLPRIMEGGVGVMEFAEVTQASIQDLVPGHFSIPEPVGKTIDSCENTLILVPGVSFDSRCNRIGYGGGYYDRYLGEHIYYKAIGLFFEQQKTDWIETDCFDISLHAIYTDQNIY